MEEGIGETVLRIARELHPEMMERTEAVARIISPEAFAKWEVVVGPPESVKLVKLRYKLQQAAAMEKANRILTLFGVNTEVDWFEILTRLAQDNGDE